MTTTTPLPPTAVNGSETPVGSNSTPTAVARTNTPSATAAPTPSNNNNTTNNSNDLATSSELPSVTPRDVRLLHLILASMGVNAYQDRVPLQLMDFAYRYTHGVLVDALTYNDHAHAPGSLSSSSSANQNNANPSSGASGSVNGGSSAIGGVGGGASGSGGPGSSASGATGSGSSSNNPAGMPATNAPLTVDDIRLAIGARVAYQFKPAPPKELLLEMAQERNKRPLPAVHAGHGLRLPPEKYCLTSKEWDLDEEYAVMDEEEDDDADEDNNNEDNKAETTKDKDGDVKMEDI